MLFSNLGNRIALALVAITLGGLAATLDAAERPSSTTTGYRVSQSSLTDRSGFVADVNGAVYERLYIRGAVVVKATNVVIRDCLIDAGGSSYAIDCTSDLVGNLLVEYCEIRNADSAMVYGGNFTVRNCNVWDGGSDAFKPRTDFLMEANWIHHLGKNELSHADGVQMVSGGNGVIRGNYFDMPKVLGYNNSQCIIMDDKNAPVVNVTIEENWFRGGGYSVQVMLGVVGSSLLSNRFRESEFAPIRNNAGSDLYIACNLDDVTGLLLPNQDSASCGTTESLPAPPATLTLN